MVDWVIWCDAPIKILHIGTIWEKLYKLRGEILIRMKTKPTVTDVDKIKRHLKKYGSCPFVYKKDEWHFVALYDYERFPINELYNVVEEYRSIKKMKGKWTILADEYEIKYEGGQFVIYGRFGDVWRVITYAPSLRQAVKLVEEFQR